MRRSRSRPLTRLFILSIVVLGCVLLGRPAPGIAALDAGYLHTNGNRLVDADGHLARLAGVTWYGMESANWVPDGLDFQRYTSIMDEVHLLGYNTIRLPFSNELVQRNPIVRHSVAANPAFRGRHALAVLDAIVAYARQIGLKIILDDHRSHAARPLEVNNLDEPLWYTRSYPEAAWIRDWVSLARRYNGDDTVLGFDLRNEPHTNGPGPWNLHVYLHQGATWGPYRGVADPKSDWRAAAERAGNAVLAVNPRLLIIVEGIQLYPDAHAPGGVDTSWWSGILTPVKRYPVRLTVPHQLVYSAHDWGPEKGWTPWFAHISSATLQAAWNKRWAFLVGPASASFAAPLWLGEFGTCNTGAGCVHRTASQGIWFSTLVDFLRVHSALSWSFFALDGTNSNDCATANGLLNPAWSGVSRWDLQSALIRAGAGPLGPGVVSRSTGPLLAGTATSRKPRDPHSQLCRLP